MQFTHYYYRDILHPISCIIQHTSSPELTDIMKKLRHRDGQRGISPDTELTKKEREAIHIAMQIYRINYCDYINYKYKIIE